MTSISRGDIYLTPTDRHWAADIEADDLLEKATKIYCLTVINTVTKEEKEFLTPSDFADWQKDHPDAIFVGHNFIAYDVVMLNRHWKAGIPVSRVVDTFILSQMYNPTRKGGHSLGAWGETLGYKKGEFSDFSRFSDEMLTYCRRDSRLTALLFRRLTERMRKVGFSEDGCRIEHLAWNIIQNKQRRNGFPFDIPAATALYSSLREREARLKEDIYKLWPPELRPVETYQKARKQDGTETATFTRHKGQFPKIVENEDGTYTAWDYVPFNLGSPAQRVEKLLSLGWTPTKFTKKTKKGGGGNPQVDEDSLLAYAEESGLEEVKKLSEWIVVNSRANMINTWINATEDDGCIRGRLFIASTLRYRHDKPNSANIPAVRKKKGDDGVERPVFGKEGGWTYESRDLWTCGDPEEWSLVGIDGTGIQNRCLIHNLIETVGEEPVAPFKELSLHGDIHKHNIEVLGLVNKAAAKKAYYCVPLSARALTKKGWKGYDEVEEGELVLTFNAEKRIKEWKPVLEKVYFDEAPLTRMWHSNGFDIKSTPNHRWFIQSRKVETKWADTPIQVKTTEELSTMQNIIVNAPLVGDDTPCPYDFTELPKYGTDWEQAVLDMSQGERRAFLSGFFIADGHTLPRGNWAWSQLRGPLFEAALLASYLCTDGFTPVSNRVQDNGNVMGLSRISKKPHVTTAHMHFEECPSEPVWCIRTENESWVMRQGDTITITGNTIMMGGQGARIAADQAQFGTKLTAKEGDKLREGIIDNIPGFQRLIDKLQDELKNTGRIRLCDETPVLVPSPHMVIPYLLQGDESRLMKLAMIFVDEVVRRNRLSKYVLKVADIHDEWQFRVKNEVTEEFVELALPCFNRAGEYFDYNIPIDGDAVVGKTWAETH